jgi:c-di-GMP-binding flagellar brake protein YcgR
VISGERRSYKRVNIRFTVRYRSLAKGKNLSGTSFTNNISSGGIYFDSIEEIPIGELLDCSIHILEKPGSMRFSSRVVRCDRITGPVTSLFGIAAEFVEPFKNSDIKLRRILKL